MTKSTRPTPIHPTTLSGGASSSIRKPFRPPLPAYSPSRMLQHAALHRLPREEDANDVFERNFTVGNMTGRDHGLENLLQMETEDNEQENLRKWAAACIVLYSTHVTSLISLLCRFNVGQFVSKEGDYQRKHLMNRLTRMEDEDCRNQLRMGKEAFGRLVQILRETKRLEDTSRSSVEEQVAKFLHIIGHNVRTRAMKFYFMRSSETVSRHFHNVLKAIISLHHLFLKQPDGAECPLEISTNSKFWPYFKDCVGAIDGSHFRVKVSSDVVHRYRGRKSYPTQNVLASCGFDLRFTYVMAGWEGSASDSRILDNSLQRDVDKLTVPRTKYYLVDAGFQLRRGFLAPYRSTRYHLKEYSVHQPQNPNELFNLRHASLRNTIERAFGVLKKRFPILASGSEAHYGVQTQADMVLAGCILHNFLMGVDPDLNLINEVDRELISAPVEKDETSSLKTRCKEGEILRERIAAEMWTDYNRKC